MSRVRICVLCTSYVCVGGVACPVSTQTHLTLECALPAGLGLALPVLVTAADQTSAPLFYSYAAPLLQDPLGPLQGDTSGVGMSGPIILTLPGTNLGVSDGSLATVLVWLVHTRTLCACSFLVSRV